MALPKQRGRSRFTIVLLLLTCLTLITLDARLNRNGVVSKARGYLRDNLAPAQGAATGTVQSVANVLDGIFRGNSLKAENSRLRAENERLRGQQAQYSEIDRVNKELQAMTQLTFAQDIPKVAARVVNSAPANQTLTVEIDRGSEHGIGVGMPVITAAGLAGRVASVTPNRSVVQLISDPGLSVGVRLQKHADPLAVLRGQGPGRPPRIELVPNGKAVELQQMVVTSGLSGLNYPAGIPVGVVEKADQVPGQASQDVQLRAYADLYRLEFVYVLQWANQGQGAPVPVTTTTLPPATTTTVPPPITASGPSAGGATTTSRPGTGTTTTTHRTSTSRGTAATRAR